MNKKLLLIVDPQNDFITGSLAVQGAKKIIAPICEWVDIAKKQGFDICVTLDWHPKDHCSFEVFPPHCIATTQGAEVANIIQHSLHNYQVHKVYKGTEKSVEEFSGVKHIRSILHLESYDEIIVCGIAGDYCVYDTVLELCELGLADKITIDINAIASIDGGTRLLELITERDLRHST